MLIVLLEFHGRKGLVNARGSVFTRVLKVLTEENQGGSKVVSIASSYFTV
jgi:hypothetical protein